MVRHGLTDMSSSMPEAASVVVDLVRLEHRLREVSCVGDRLGSLTCTDNCADTQSETI